MNHARTCSRLATAALLCAVSGGATAQSQTGGSTDYPAKPIRFIVHAPAGGGFDLVARAISQKLTETWGRQVLVDNRTGATGTIALDLTARAPADGYTICTVSASQAVDAAINPGLLNEFARNFSAISQVSTNFYVVYGNPSFPARSVRELIDHARAHPGKINYASAGVGSHQHLAWEVLAHTSGIRLHHVPYKGGGTVVGAVLTGDVQVAMTSLTAVRPHMAAGRLRGLAITAGRRSEDAPELPTVAESGVPGYEMNNWLGVIAGARVPPAIIGRLNTGIVEALKAPEVVQRLRTDGSTPIGSRAEELAAHIRTDIARWSALVKDARLALN